MGEAAALSLDYETDLRSDGARSIVNVKIDSILNCRGPYGSFRTSVAALSGIPDIDLWSCWWLEEDRFSLYVGYVVIWRNILP